MMKQISIYLGIFLVLAISRFIPHPPNFTSLLALSFGLKYLPVLLISFAITDLFIGYHTGTHWTWGSVLVIGLISQYFCKNINFRLIGASTGAFIFFAITNFGVWISSDMYANSFEGLLTAYVMAIPFSIILFINHNLSVLIEFLYKVTKINFQSQSGK